MKEYQEIRDTSPLGIKMLNDQLRLLWFKTKNTSTKDVRDGAITVNKIASDVGKSLDLSSNEAITLRVTKDEFNSLEIGGRNLLLKSNISKTSSTYNIGTFTSTRDFVPGETLTVTIKGNIPGSKLFGIWFNSGSLNAGSIPKISDGLYSLKVTVPSATTTRSVGIYLVGNQANTDSWTVEWIKLEKGSKATDWSPAPEELTEKDKIISEINLSEEAIKIQANKINLVGAVTVLSDITGNLGAITAGTITGATVRTSTGSNRIQLTNSVLETYLNNVKRIQLDYDSLDFFTPSGKLGGTITSIDEQPEYYGPDVTDFEIRNNNGFITLVSGVETSNHSRITINKELPEHWGSVEIMSGSSNYYGSVFVGIHGVSLARANGAQPGTSLEVTELGIDCMGDFSVYNGTKAATVDTKDYGMRKLYALETPDNRFVTYIETKLEKGEHFIEIEPMFRQTISDYFVIPHIQNMASVSIVECKEDGFSVLIEVKDAEVVFEVNGKRIGYEAIYMEEAIQNKQTDRINGGVKK